MKKRVKIKKFKVIKNLHQLSNQMQRVSEIMLDSKEVDQHMEYRAEQMASAAMMTKSWAKYLGEVN